MTRINWLRLSLLNGEIALLKIKKFHWIDFDFICCKDDILTSLFEDLLKINC